MPCDPRHSLEKQLCQVHRERYREPDILAAVLGAQPLDGLHVLSPPRILNESMAPPIVLYRRVQDVGSASYPFDNWRGLASPGPTSRRELGAGVVFWYRIPAAVKV